MKKKIIRKIPKNKFVKKYKKIAKEAIKMARKPEVEKQEEVEKEEVKEVNENILRKNSGHLNLEEK